MSTNTTYDDVVIRFVDHLKKGDVFETYYPSPEHARNSPSFKHIHALYRERKISLKYVNEVDAVDICPLDFEDAIHGRRYFIMLR